MIQVDSFRNVRVFCGALLVCGVLASSTEVEQKTVKLGVENIPRTLMHWLKTRRVGLVMNHTSKTQCGMRTVDFLLQQKVNIARLFAPEHGLDGTVQASKTVHTTYDAVTHIPVVGIYNTGPKRALADHAVGDLDVLIFDMQDTGMRHFTYISTLLHMMQCAAHFHIPFIVLDRPNPLGYCMEGPVGQLLCLPQVTLAQLALPLRHGLTVGELALYFNHAALHDAVDVQVIPMQGYDRSTALPPVASYALSPNIQSRNACYGYSFLGLLGEVRPFDVAIATEKAFQCILLPEDIPCSPATWRAAQQLFKQQGIASSTYSYYSKRKKKWCRGLYFSIHNGNTVHSFETFIKLVQLFVQAGVSIVFSQGFDHAIGSDKVRLFLSGALDQRALCDSINYDLQAFFKRVQPCILYTPVPKIIEYR